MYASVSASAEAHSVSLSASAVRLKRCPDRGVHKLPEAPRQLPAHSLGQLHWHQLGRQSRCVRSGCRLQSQLAPACRPTPSPDNASTVVSLSAMQIWASGSTAQKHPARTGARASAPTCVAQIDSWISLTDLIVFWSVMTQMLRNAPRMLSGCQVVRGAVPPQVTSRSSGSCALVGFKAFCSPPRAPRWSTG